MIKVFLQLIILCLTITSCSTTFNKQQFKKFNSKQFNGNLLKTNGYYFYKTNLNRYKNFVVNGSEFTPTDSILKTSITGMLFYKNNNVYVIQNYFDGLTHDNPKSLNIAQSKLEKHIDTFKLKTIDLKKNHISTLGKYIIKNDTITIQYFRHQRGNRLLNELKGVLNNDNQFRIFQIKKFNIPVLGVFKTKPDIYSINQEYSFKAY